MAVSSRPTGTNRRKLAAVSGAVVLLLLVLLFVQRDPKGDSAAPTSSSSAADESPADCVTAMMLARKTGDVEAYLDCFAGPLREQLQSRMAGKSTDQLSTQLQSAADELTGQATTNIERPEPGVVTLTLERIYPDYNERHRVRLEKRGGQWKIVKLTPVERFAPTIPYGAPVFPGANEEQGEQSQANPEQETPTGKREPSP